MFAVDPLLYVERGDQTYRLIPIGEHDHNGAPEANRWFQELREATFRLVSQDPIDAGWRLLIDDVALKCRNGDSGAWLWKPRFYAGEVEAALWDSNRNCYGRWRLDVSPDGTKLGRDAFIQMLEKIYNNDATLALGTEPARQQFGALGEHQDPVVEFLRLRHCSTSIGQALTNLLQEPFHSLRPHRRLSPMHLVRRMDRRTVRVALTQPALLSTVGAILPTTDPGTTELPLVDVPDVERHLDNPPNRCLLYALRALMRRCDRLLDELEGKAHSGSSDTKSGIEDRWPEWKAFLTTFQCKLKRANDRLPFSDVSKAEISAGGLNAVASHPLWSRFWRVSWEALRHGVAGPKPTEWLPLNPTWEIYERWCFLELSRWLQELLQDRDGEDWQKSSPSGADRLLTRRLSNGVTVCLHLQREFPNSGGKEKEFWSISGKRRPDIVLTWRRDDSIEFLVFDAKYLVARDSVLAAMQSAHIYNDSLRMNQARPTACVLLIPAKSQASELETQEFFDQHGSAVLPLHPNLSLPEWFENRILQLLK